MSCTSAVLSSSSLWRRTILSKNRLFRQPSHVMMRGFSTGSNSAATKKAKVALIGSGRMGQIRASILMANPRFDFVGVVDVNQNGATELAHKVGVNAYTELHEMLEDQNGQLDGIVMCSPTHTHHDVIQQVAHHNQNNGVDAQVAGIFTEKPVGESAAQIDSLFDMAKTANLHLCCGFQRRFDPSYVAAAQAIANQEIGTPVVANLFFADHPIPPREFLLQGGDIFLDLCAHDVDFITNALQDDIISVYATGTSMDKELQEAGVHDNAIMVMNFSNGAVATLFMSRCASYGYDQRCEVFGNNGGLLSIQNQPETTTVLSNAQGIHHSRLLHSFPQRFAQAFALEIDAFYDTVFQLDEWPITGEQCVKVQRVADAARESCREGRLVSLEY
ncbi:Myo-inositol 2-dehydrogenase [Seminavis robusta]|uniref:Myo-inositol 2-dehydrogenase n=1 Tax=Seminavis robusta TaxID=568900 RepID=A0A9N8DXV9_9STRA|nr:Myo-inositol 2-dehydrogenase [Seminavis robusta]|eukprot:Sro460_g147450.1 Myo-inositol 2-dehydrogenase (389) ;mRNA; f:19148-20534